MILAEVAFCITLLIGSSVCNPIDAPKAKQLLDLSYSCMRVRSGNTNDDRAPIVLLHGIAMFKESWTGLYQVLALKTGRRVCVVDLRNHGDSPWSDDADIGAMASDLNALLTTLKTKKIILLGHSLGGKVAVHFTLNNPEKVEKVIIEDMRPNGIPPEAFKMIVGSLKILQSCLSAIPKGVEEKTAKLLAYKAFKESLAKVNVTLQLVEGAAPFFPIKCSKDKCEWKTNMKLLEKVILNPLKYLTKSSGLFDKPALFVYGKASPFKVNEDETEIRKLFPKAKLVGVEGATHIVHRRPEFLDAVVKFINSEN